VKPIGVEQRFSGGVGRGRGESNFCFCFILGRGVGEKEKGGRQGANGPASVMRIRPGAGRHLQSPPFFFFLLVGEERRI
jgi:hypothetical protein